MKVSIVAISKTLSILFLVSYFFIRGYTTALILSALFVIILLNIYMVGYYRKTSVNPPLWIIPLSYSIYYALLMIADEKALVNIVVLTSILTTLAIAPDSRVVVELGKSIRLALLFMLTAFFIVALLNLSFYTFYVVGPVLEALWIDLFGGSSVFDKVSCILIVSLYYSFYPMLIPYVMVLSIIKLFMSEKNMHVYPIIGDYVSRIVYGWFIGLGY